MKEDIRKPCIMCAALIALCFLVTSAGWLAWEYHLLTMLPTRQADFCTMVVGYLLQAVGVGLYILCRRAEMPFTEKLFPSALILHMTFLFPAVLSPYPAGALAFGFLMNLACGLIAGNYLSVLTEAVPNQYRATVFGVGYGISILLMWILSSLGHERLYDPRNILSVCLILTAASIYGSFQIRRTGAAESESENSQVRRSERTADHLDKQVYGRERAFLLSAALLVLLFSIVNSSGFAFSSADLGQSVNVEFSRLAYASGLIAAGFVTDRSRKYGAVCALACLMIPFIILSLQGAGFSLILFWLLSYLTFGFYSVYRIILFSDLASQKNRLYLSGAGLMIGRIGDAVGESICLLLSDRLAVRVLVTAVLFAGAVAVFFRLYQSLYVPEAEQHMSEKEKLYLFSVEHDLSARERDLLVLLLDGRTNKEIAEQLTISENTVKFHVRNILQKTGCKNRGDLVAVYVSHSRR